MASPTIAWFGHCNRLFETHFANGNETLRTLLCAALPRVNCKGQSSRFITEIPDFGFSETKEWSIVKIFYSFVQKAFPEPQQSLFSGKLHFG
ncbi:MAG: hypothetical protein ACUVSQ_10350 [Pseudanabaenaceae cyanobacterium]